jgi:hypothetical protein
MLGRRALDTCSIMCSARLPMAGFRAILDIAGGGWVLRR